MQFVVLAALFCVAAAKLQLSASGSWSYDAQDKWPGVCTTGKQQSPIDISTKDAERVNMTELRFQNYDTFGPFSVTGNGKSVRVYGFDGWEKRPYIDAGGLDGRYNLDEIHFHWYHKREHPGSEHSINGTHYPIEVHMAHRGQIEGREHIAVVAIFVQFNETHGISSGGLSGLFRPIEEMDNVKSPSGENRTVSYWPAKGQYQFQPQELLPADHSRFYRYEGSLTTPDCDEVVTWTVMEAPLFTTKRQWDLLTNVRMRNGPTEFVHNQRSQQELNGRRVILRDPTASPSGAAHDRCAFWSLVTAIAALLIVDVNVPDGICF